MSERSRQIASRIQDEHERLEEQIAAIRDELSRPVDAAEFPDWKLEFVWKIRDFQNQLTKHFDLEEDGGFMEDVLSKAPRFTPRVRMLELEHVSAVKQLEDITASLKQMSGLDTVEFGRIKGRIMGLFETLEAHEAAERELILEVYFLDIGVGD